MLENVFDSECLPSVDRLDAWRDITSRSLTPTVFDVEGADGFRATLQAMDLGATNVTTMTYSSMRCRRTPKLIRRSDPELYAVGLILGGRQTVAQAEREAAPEPHNLVLYSTFKPFDSRVDASDSTASSVLAQVPRTLIPFSGDKADRLLATSMSGREGIGALLAQFLTRLATDATSYKPTDAPRLGMILLDLLTALIAHHTDTAAPLESRQRALYLRIKAFIHQHLSDPHLTPDAIAGAHHISTRQLHRLFQDHKVAVAAYIRCQRLEHTRRDLADPALASRPIHAIATRWGFIHPEAFSRAFQTAYGLSPRDHRRHALPDARIVKNPARIIKDVPDLALRDSYRATKTR